MNQYQIFDNNVGGSIFRDLPVISANKPIEAIRQYLKSIGQGDKRVKVSASNYVRICAKPVVIENGQTYILGGKRQVWVEVN